ncbi:flavin reductase family protein [Clostridium aestuarii]|uniref:Flavin reductase family protein n=1 Tax=Clostridium aestuarii TaxID=338193 RepID=A0ABT4D4B7_9CLOT|nr:flavin reductase family protein [Clostridium aestuarii]
MVNFTRNIEKGIEYLYKQGAFLTVKVNDKVNTMTIGWGNIGFQWKKPIFTVLVRQSRYTYGLMEKAKNFTVSVPLDNDMKEALAFCGSKSGRNLDKFKECNLSMEKSRKISSPSIENCGLVYECRIIYKQDMDLNLLDKDIKKACYPKDDKHVMYYGEIVDCYLNK